MERTIALPVWLWIDPSTRCNLSCALCYTKESHGDEYLLPDDLARIVKGLQRSHIEPQEIRLNWRGEPLMNPHFARFPAIVKTAFPHVPLRWNTNGILLTRARVQELAAGGIEQEIFVSVDGGNETAHDRNRGYGSYRQTLNGLTNLIDAARAAPHLRVGIYQIDLGVSDGEYDPELLQLEQRVGRKIVVPALQSEISGTVPQGPCFWIGHALCIDPRGDAWVCLITHSALGRVGNVLKEPVEVVLERALEMRKSILLAGRSSLAHCRNCRKREGVADASLALVASKAQ